MRRRGWRRKATALVLFALLFGAFCHAGAQVFRGYSQSGSLQMRSDLRGSKKVISTYYPSGKIEAVYEYENGKLNGAIRQYYENGVLKTETRYKNDKREGTAKFYYQSGMLKARIEYRNDVQTGVAVYYDENGRPLSADGDGTKQESTAPSSPAR